MRRGFLYLVAIMDWATRKGLAWKLSNTMDVGFCVEALKEALARFGAPEIFNTDQGAQFTSFDFTAVLWAAPSCESYNNITLAHGDAVGSRPTQHLTSLVSLAVDEMAFLVKVIVQH